jgi:CheY-like chemotaxis protein
MDGRHAIGEMARKRVDLIVTDLDMPGMDGVTFLGMLIGNPILRNKPVLVLSGHVTPEIRQRFKDCPNIRFLVKPCESPAIGRLARELLRAS